MERRIKILKRKGRRRKIKINEYAKKNNRIKVEKSTKRKIRRRNHRLKNKNLYIVRFSRIKIIINKKQQRKKRRNVENNKREQRKKKKKGRLRKIRERRGNKITKFSNKIIRRTRIKKSRRIKKKEWQNIKIISNGWKSNKVIIK